MKQFCMKIDLIAQRRENVPSSMAAMTSHETLRHSAMLGARNFVLSIKYSGEVG